MVAEILLNQSKFLGFLAVFLGACSYGLLSTFVKLAYDRGYNLAQITGVQTSVGFVFLMILFIVQKKLFTRTAFFSSDRDEKKAQKQWFLVGLLGALVGLFYYASVKYCPASIAVVYLFQFVWIGFIIEACLQKKWPTWIDFMSLILVLLGTVFSTQILGKESADLESFSWIGLGFGMLAALAYALFLILNARFSYFLGVIERSFYSQFGAVLFIALIFVWSVSVADFQSFELWGFGLLLGLFGTILPPLLFAYGMPKIGGSYGTLVSSIELPVAITFACFVLNEKIDALQIVGIFLILGAIALPIWKKD